MSTTPYYFYPGVSVQQKKTFKRLFIYHVPKTGTLSVFTALRCSVSLFLAQLKHVSPDFGAVKINRYDDENLLDGGRVEQEHALIASHLPWGAHERFNMDFDFVTILRDAYSRVLSSYTYNCMRNGLKPSAVGFERHFRDAINQNVSVRQLAGYRQGEVVPEIAVEVAKHTLERRFSFYGVSSQISDVVSAYLSWCGLPNVIMGRINQTEDEFKIDGSAYREEILELNKLDQALYAHVEKCPKPLPDGVVIGEGGFNEWTVLVNEVANDKASEIAIRAIQTARVEPHLVNGKLSQESFDELFEKGGFFEMN